MQLGLLDLYINLPCILLYIIWCVQTADRRRCAKICCVKQVSNSLSLFFSVGHPIPQLWLTANSVSDKPLCRSLISPSPRGQSFTPLNQSCPAPMHHFLPHLRLMQWHIKNAVRGFCWAVLHWDIEIQPKINFHRQRRPDHPIPSHHVFPLRLAASEGCLPQATCLSNSEPWIIIFCCLFSYFV